MLGIATGDRPTAVVAASGGLSAFGLDVQADFELPGLRARAPRTGGHELHVRLAPYEELRPLAEEPRVMRLLHILEERPYAVLEGEAGDLVFCHGQGTLFHLAADRRLLRCAPAQPRDPRWRRLLLDDVLWTVSLLRGFELMHASCVLTPQGVVAFVAASGGGKSSLAAELMRRGAALFCDDVLALAPAGDSVVGHPGPPLMNLPLGIAPATVDATPIAELGDELWVEVDRDAVEPSGMAAVVLIDRVAGNATRCSRLEPNPLPLIPHTVTLPFLPERVKQRFALVSALASSAALLHLSADPSVLPSALADMVEAQIAAG